VRSMVRQAENILSNDGCHPMRRMVIDRARRETMVGMRMTAWMNRRNSIVMYGARSVLRCSIIANHYLRFHASVLMTMWAHFETRSYSGTRRAPTPFLSCSMTFS
jgi:hypothetical protein